jgi:hypothetical protein
MPRLPFKRKASLGVDAINAYIPSQLTDYTSLPPLEDDQAPSRLSSLPLIARVGVIMLPILLVLLGSWFMWKFVFGTPAPQAQIQSNPSLTIASARAVSQDAIVVEAEAPDVVDGTVVTTQLLENGKPIDWADLSTVTTTVEQEQITLRMVEAGDRETPLRAENTYSVNVTLDLDEGEPLVAQAELHVPTQLVSSFYDKEVAEQAAVEAAEPSEDTITEPVMPEPVADAPSPGSSAAASDSTDTGIVPTIEVAFDSAVLISPTLGSKAIGTVYAGSILETLSRSDDSNWFLVPLDEQKAEVAWLHASNLNISEEELARVPSVKPDPATIEQSPYKGDVFNGGNIRYYPDLQRGTVMGQLHAGQTIALHEKTFDGMWYRVTASEASGWVSVTLLSIDEGVVGQVPVAP